MVRGRLPSASRKDAERGLNLKLRIENYTSNRETKDFIVEQAHLMAPQVRAGEKEEITSSRHPTYGDLVRQYIALNKMKRFEKIPTVATSTSSPSSSQRRRGRRVWRQSLRGQSSRNSTSPRTMRLGSRRRTADHLVRSRIDDFIGS
jgi:hypothetical protein